MIDVKDLVFGLTWLPAISDDRNEVKKLSAELKSNAYIEKMWEGVSRYGFASVKRLNNKRSAAAVLAELLEGGTGVFVHQLNRDESCFIAVKNHLPVIDIIGGREEVILAAKEYVTKHQQDDGLIRIYGDAIEIAGAVGYTIQKLSDESEGIGELQPVRKTNTKAVAIALFLGTLILFWFYADIMEYVAPTRKDNMPDARIAHHNAVANAVNTVVNQNQFPAEVMAGFIPFAKSTAAEANGWQLNRIVCTGIDCMVTWKRTPGATIKGFLSAMQIQENDSSISFPNIDEIARKLSFSKIVPRPERKLVLSTRMKYGEIIVSWLQQLKDSQFPSRLDNLTPLVPFAGVTGIPAEDMPMVAAYSFTVPYQEINKVSELPDVMTIEGITLTYTDRNRVSVEITGKYYAL